MSSAVILYRVVIQKALFRMLWDSNEERDSDKRRLIDGRDGGKRGQIEQEHYSLLSFGSSPL